jgi:D-sedoheptulose 7-phosphate isomerase
MPGVPESGDADALGERLRHQIGQSIAAKQALLASPEAAIEVARLLIDSYRRGNAMFLFGNGGSAADAQHIAAEFLGHFYIERPALPAHALTVNTSALTAIANDYSYENVFARQLQALGRAGDVAIGISTSGNAANVAAGLSAARDLQMATVALTGSRGGRAREIAEYWVGVPSEDVPRIQEAHIMLGHIWSELVEAALFGPEAVS